MKRTDLEALGLEKDVVDKVMEMHGADIEEKKNKISELEGKISDKDKIIKDNEDKITKLGEDLKAGEGDAETIKNLQKQVEDYKEAEKQRKDAEAKAAADKTLTDNIIEAFGDKKFVNEYTKNSLIAQIKDELGKDENQGKGIKDIFETITKDSTDIFANPQHEDLNLPGVGGQGNGGSDDALAKARAIMGLETK